MSDIKKEAKEDYIMQSENTNIPAFLGKLWKMVNDPSTDTLICWSAHGNSFIIQNQAQFWYELLPVYYKHNNMSSFVRQLNMYGFHKISTVENGAMDAMDKDEIQFYHPYFQKDQPELLKMIKRKATTRPHEQSTNATFKGDDLTKALIDVKQLRGRQKSVDSQLCAMKQENVILWRELALLRQKHLKQQQIVNKLIQFLVTLVQPPANPRMGVGVKRRMPLMLHETPNKKAKSRKQSQTKDVGPTIHELEEEIGISPEQLLDDSIEEDIPLEALDSAIKKRKIQSPVTPTSSSGGTSGTNPKVTSPLLNNMVHEPQQGTSHFAWDKPDYVSLTDQINHLTENDEELLNTLQSNTSEASEKIFLNPGSGDTLIGNLVNPITYNPTPMATKNIANQKKQTNSGKSWINSQQNQEMPVAEKDNNLKHVKIQNGSDLDSHLDNTQVELDQLKDILDGCNNFDTNTVLGTLNVTDHDATTRRIAGNNNLPESLLQIFTNCADQDGNFIQNKDSDGDPLVAGTDLPESMIDFNELLDDSLNQDDGSIDLLNPAILETQLQNTTGLNTPLNINDSKQPVFLKRI